ncbi:MAG: DUF4956 domain-containing protein [Gemmatimonadaceae bacterium]|nr:DUF4956 domain-containing protein [Gemmatimonadaceae bacterium]
MEAVRSRSSSDSGSRVIIRVVLYYAVLLTAGWVLLRRIPSLPSSDSGAFEALFGLLPNGGVAPQGSAPTLDEARLAIAVAASMLASILLSIPVAWVYLLTRAKKGYQQSVVQLLIILPLVVAGIVVMVKYSLALAFSLAGIVAAVRFRNTLDDSKDAVYVFLATAVGLAAAVNIPVAAVISILFNATMLVLWSTDFGHAPVALDGNIAERRLKQARELARTGTFVAQLDNEVFRNMTREQLEGVAERAWKRANESEMASGSDVPELILRIVTSDSESLRAVVEPRLTAHVKKWTLDPTADSLDEDSEVLEYSIRLRKKGTPEELEALVRAAASQWLISVEIQ